MIHSASNNLNVSIFVDTVVEGSIQRYHSYYCVLITPVVAAGVADQLPAVLRQEPGLLGDLTEVNQQLEVTVV